MGRTETPEIAAYQALQESWRLRTLSSLFKSGLMSADEQRRVGISGLYSFDKENFRQGSVIHGCFYFRPDQKGIAIVSSPNGKWQELTYGSSTQSFLQGSLTRIMSLPRQVEMSLYTSAWSMLPSLTERVGEDLHRRGSDDGLVEDRIKNTILIMIPASRVSIARFFPNAELDKSVLSSDFELVLAPEVLTDASAFSSSRMVKVVSVPLVSKKIETMFVPGKTYTIPDYEEIILHMLENYPEPFFIHGVRLPTLEDTMKRYVDL